MKNLAAAAKKIDEPHARDLLRAIDQWEKGKGIFAVEDWMKDPKSVKILKAEKMKEPAEEFKVAQTAASELVKTAIPHYNEIAERRNQRVRERRSFARELPIIRSSWWGRPHQEELPLYHYRPLS